MVAFLPVFTLRNIPDQIGLTSPARLTCVTRGILLGHWQTIFAALGYWWWADANVSWRGEILLHDRPARFLTFWSDCGEETPHEGLDEFGSDRYAQICHRRRCG